MRSDGLRVCICVLLTLDRFTAAYFSLGTDPLSSKLWYYEIIEPERTIEKEGHAGISPASYNRQERLTFTAFKRQFVVYLTPKRGILHSNFHFLEVGPDGAERMRSVNPDEHYEGHVYGSNDSVVSLTFDDYGAMLGIIRVGRELYTFEPARLHKEDATLREVLAYRSADMKMNFAVDGPKFCVPLKPPKFRFVDPLSWTPKRYKRDADEEGEVVRKNRCPLRVVADYSFFEVVGNKSTAFTSRYIINVVDRINTLYTVVDWGVDRDGKRLVNMGFMIKDMKVHTSITNNPNHYNRHKKGDFVNVNGLLEEFTLEEGRDDYCLVHLFTGHSFENGVLGLGYISSSEIESSGGICSLNNRNKNGSKFAYNTALSSARTTQGGVVVSREADLVTAHELGHNWGATHDDSKPDCSPTYRRGGAYLMNTFSVSGYDANNYKFSPCSKLMIGKVLARKASMCFEEEKSSFCGNGRIENGTDGVVEQCDVGGKWLGDDKCCHFNCTLKAGKQCSPKNSPCCSEDCQFLPSSHICLHENPFQCRGSSFCTGSSGECPEPKPTADGTGCVDQGECRGGRCLSFCERMGLEPCICPKVKESCYRCCRSHIDKQDKRCTPYQLAPQYILRNGTRCIHGYCSGGVCIKEVADGVAHLWLYFQNYDTTNFMKIFRDNLVGLIALVMLIVWIPISCALHRIDNIRAVTAREDNVEMITESRISSPVF